RAAQSRHAAGPGQAASHIRPPFPEIPLQVNVRKDAALLSSQSGKQHRVGKSDSGGCFDKHVSGLLIQGRGPGMPAAVMSCDRQTATYISTTRTASDAA
ncbi:MAG: hypothetical protein OXC08_15815, partial [Thiotrichales bacterium]|nr:hypothetical protein [Thiotrichales bacterium]